MVNAEHALPEAGDFPWLTITDDEIGTEDLGRRFGALLRGGEIVLLYGTLGAGKTCFARGLCRGLGVTDDVVSPTFTLVNTYPGPLTAHHLDFYRIGRETPLEDIGVMEILDEVEAGTAVLMAEWPEPLLPELVGMDRVYSWLAEPGPGVGQRTWRLKLDASCAGMVVSELNLRSVKE